MATKLDRETATYNAKRADLAARFPGKWVLIHGRSVVGTYKTQRAALTAGYTRFGYVDLFTKRLGALEQPVVLASRRSTSIAGHVHP